MQDALLHTLYALRSILGAWDLALGSWILVIALLSTLYSLFTLRASSMLVRYVVWRKSRSFSFLLPDGRLTPYSPLSVYPAQLENPVSQSHSLV